MNQCLTSLRNRSPGGRSLTIVFRNFRRRAAEELDHGMLAQVQLPGAPEIEDTGEGNRSRHRFLESRETERKMSSSGVSGDTDSPGIEIGAMLCGAAQQQMVGGTDVLESARPS